MATKAIRKAVNAAERLMLESMSDEELMDVVADGNANLTDALPHVADDELEAFIAGRLTERQLITRAKRRRKSGQAPFYPPIDRRRAKKSNDRTAEG